MRKRWRERQRARNGLVRATEGLEIGSASGWTRLNVEKKALMHYRMTLFGTGAGNREEAVMIPRADAVRVIEREQGKLPLVSLLRCRVRYFTDGLVLGSADYIRRVGAEPSGNRKRRDLPVREPGWRNIQTAKGFCGPILE